MRKIVTALPLLVLPLLLTACVDDDATYYVDGGNQHTLSVHRTQPYFWSDQVNLELLAARLPDCQRRYPLARMPADDSDVELYASGDNVWTLRAGKQSWQIETQTCTLTADPKGEPGEPVGVFRADHDQYVFEPAVTTNAAAPAAAPADGAAAPASDAAAAPAAPETAPAAAAPAASQ